MATQAAQQTAAARHIPPAGAHGVKTETFEASSPEVKALIRQLNRLASATTLEEHNAALQGFDEDATLDTPIIQIQGRDRIRTLLTLTKFFLGTFEIEPRLVTITVPEAGKGGLLDVDGVVHWLPHRPWYLPVTFLLPRDIPIYADVSLGIKAHNDRVYFVSGKNHNLPHVPRLLRVLAGYVAGIGAGIVEPAYNNLRDWYRAGAEGVSTTNVSVKETATGVTQSAREAAQRGVEAVKEAVAPFVEGVAERASAVGKAAESVGARVAGAMGTAGA